MDPSIWSVFILECNRKFFIPIGTPLVRASVVREQNVSLNRPTVHSNRVGFVNVLPRMSCHQIGQPSESMVSLAYRSLANFVVEDNLIGLRAYLENRNVTIDERDEVRLLFFYLIGILVYLNFTKIQPKQQFARFLN